MRISDWSSDVCSSDLIRQGLGVVGAGTRVGRLAEVLRIAGIDEADLNTHGPERVGEEVPGAAVEAAGADDVVAAARDLEDHQSGRRLAGTDGQFPRCAFQRGHPLLTDGIRRISHAGVAVCTFLPPEKAGSP